MSLVSMSVARRDVYAEFGDVVRRLLALQAVLIAGQEFAVVIQLDRAQRLVLRKVIAIGDLDGCARGSWYAASLRSRRWCSQAY